MDAQELKRSEIKDREGPDPLDVAVGARIRTRRRSLGLSQGALAQALGVTFQQVQKYERGVNRVSASMLIRAGRALEMTASALLGEDEEADRSSDVELARRSVLRHFDALPDAAARQTAVALLETLSRQSRKGG